MNGTGGKFFRVYWLSWDLNENCYLYDTLVVGSAFYY